MPPNNDSTVTEVHYKLGQIRKVILTCVMDSGDGSFDSTALTSKFEGRLLKMCFNAEGPPVDVPITKA